MAAKEEPFTDCPSQLIEDLVLRKRSLDAKRAQAEQPFSQHRMAAELQRTP